MGLRTRKNPYGLTPEQMGQMNRPDLFLGALDENLSMMQENTEPPVEQVVAEPTTLEVTNSMNEPFDENLPDISAQPIPPSPLPNESTPALSTEIEPSTAPSPAEPSAEPGKTVASEEAKSEKEKNEYEQLFTDYGKARETYATETEALGKEAEETGKKQAMMTGISGALQAFGEGLAAITGGSAKPIQTGAQTIQRLGEQEAATQERKAKTLKERLMLARQPLEAKAEEIKFRDVFEQRQLKKALIDPNSKQSAQARDLANSFLDTYIASIGSRAGEDEIARVEGVRPKLEKMNAEQIQQFIKNLQSLKFTESKAELEATKAEGKKVEAQTKREQKLQDVADKEFSTDSKKLVETVDGLKRFQQRIGTFQNDVKLALGGDKEAAKRVVQNQGAVSYLIARQDEPKGVFTEQDYAVLNRLGSGLTWSQQLQNWMSKGFRAEYAPDALRNLDEVLTQLEFTKQDPGELVKNYKKIYELSDNPFKKDYANRFDKVVNISPKPITAEQPSAIPSETAEPLSFPDIESAKKAKKDGKIKSGDIITINGKQQKVK